MGETKIFLLTIGRTCTAGLVVICHRFSSCPSCTSTISRSAPSVRSEEGVGFVSLMNSEGREMVML